MVGFLGTHSLISFDCELASTYLCFCTHFTQKQWSIRRFWVVHGVAWHGVGIRIEGIGARR